MSDHSWGLQKAIFDALTGDAALMGMVTGVFDRPPQGTAFPYVTLGEATVVDGSDKTNAGQEHTLTLHAWSRERGRKEVKDIMAQVFEVLHDKAIAVTGFVLVNLRFEFGETMLDGDGLTHHGIARYRAVTHDL